MGSVVTAFVQNLLSLRTQTKIRVFQERKEAYIGLLEAWLRQENSKYCEASVFSLLKKWQETDPGSPDRIQVTNDLKTAMRHDLR
ncbi:hypothetical protein PhaeoP54_02527 [Phaeobacter inhibens]|nr:hypothetical protein PhaeoP54_02527 [Phaeobacter inhibens]